MILLLQIKVLRIMYIGNLKTGKLLSGLIIC